VAAGVDGWLAGACCEGAAVGDGALPCEQPAASAPTTISIPNERAMRDTMTFVPTLLCADGLERWYVGDCKAGFTPIFGGLLAETRTRG
jgi:hypothetical protein